MSDYEYNDQDELKQEPKKKIKVDQRIDCPYLSSIRRHLLDFDFEKLCSVTLNNLNVYACLVCGKYFQGRGKGTNAYMHSLEANHNVFINLHDSKVYCLPDNYEVVNQSLWDIKYNLNPNFTKEKLQALDKNTNESRGLDGTEYLPGFVGLNNLKNTDYVNVTIQALCRVPPLRDFFIFFEPKTPDPSDQILSRRFAELIRKIWNDKNFKGHVSPHELLQAIGIKSNKRFKIGEQSDPIQLMAWFLDKLEREQPKKNNIITECFRGVLEVKHYKPLRDGYQDEPVIENKQFLFLTLDIPAAPLHKNAQEKSMIPHIHIYELLKKFDGCSLIDNIDGRRIFSVTKFPKYLILHMKRFQMNNFFMEKNPTIVQFPLNNLEFTSGEQTAKYNLLTNICHEGNALGGYYKVHVRNKAKNAWYLIQDLHTATIIPELIEVSEAYIQIYELIEQ